MIGLSWGVGNSSTSANLLATLPSLSPQRTLSNSVAGGTDLYPIASLSWSKDNDNWMAYLTGDIPTGAYNAQRLSNLGIGHGAIDAGGGYTYLNQKTGFELSAVVGFTGNWKNPDTSYRNGVERIQVACRIGGRRGRVRLQDGQADGISEPARLLGVLGPEPASRLRAVRDDQPSVRPVESQSRVLTTDSDATA